MYLKFLSGQTEVLYRHTITSNLPYKRISDLKTPEFINYIRSVLTNYAKENKINIISKGMRFAIDVTPNGSLKIYMVHNVAAAQDVWFWNIPKSEWKPGLESGKGGFFEFCASAAENKEEKMKFGNPLVYLNNKDNQIFAVIDGNPRAEYHWCIMSKKPHATLLDNQFKDGEIVSTFSDNEFQQVFDLVVELYERHGNNKFLRLVSNIGQNFQQGQRFHMHVMLGDYFPSLFPEEYGFQINSESFAVDFDLNDHRQKGLMDLINEYNNTRIPNKMDFATINGLTPKLKEILSEFK